MELKVEILKVRGRAGTVRGKAYIKGVCVAESEFMFSLVEKEERKP